MTTVRRRICSLPNNLKQSNAKQRKARQMTDIEDIKHMTAEKLCSANDLQINKWLSNVHHDIKRRLDEDPNAKEKEEAFRLGCINLVRKPDDVRKPDEDPNAKEKEEAFRLGCTNLVRKPDNKCPIARGSFWSSALIWGALVGMFVLHSRFLQKPEHDQV